MQVKHGTCRGIARAESCAHYRSFSKLSNTRAASCEQSILLLCVQNESYIPLALDTDNAQQLSQYSETRAEGAVVNSGASGFDRPDREKSFLFLVWMTFRSAVSVFAAGHNQSSHPFISGSGTLNDVIAADVICTYQCWSPLDGPRLRCQWYGWPAVAVMYMFGARSHVL